MPSTVWKKSVSMLDSGPAVPMLLPSLGDARVFRVRRSCFDDGHGGDVEPVRPGSDFDLEDELEAARTGDPHSGAPESAAVPSEAILARVGRLDDALTGLLNHSAFHERLAEEIRRATRHRATVGLLIFDIDHFLRLNDTWGHSVGDEVLRGVA